MNPDLLRSVLENPKDDNPRLVYADWLEENGDLDRSELIRIQIRLHDIKDEVKLRIVEPISIPDPLVVENRRLKQRASQLFLIVCKFKLPSQCWPFNADDMRTEWERGFPHKIELKCTDFMKHAETIFRQTPIQEVRLTDKSFRNDLFMNYAYVCFCGSCGEQACLPKELLAAADRVFSGRNGLTERHPRVSCIDEEHADGFASRTCVAYGRSLAGLPDLEERRFSTVYSLLLTTEIPSHCLG